MILKGELSNIIKVACIYMATIIGAGFASGQEIVQFFSTYYEGGFYGIIMAGILFAVIGYIVLDKVYTERIRNYDELVFPMVGWVMGWIMEAVVTIFMLCLFCIMIAGMGSIINEKTALPFNISVVIVAIICMVVMLTDIKGIITLSAVITPILITGIILTGMYIIISKDTSVFLVNGYLHGVTKNWFFSSLTYVSYNSIMSLVVMSSLLPYLKTRRVGIIGGIAGGLILCAVAFILNTAIFMFYPNFIPSELPVLSILGRYSNTLSSLYTLILWLAMLVSAVTAGYYFVERISSKLKVSTRLMTLIICAMVIPLSGVGFSNLIATLYPLFGYIGLFMIFAVLLQGLKLRPLGSLVKKSGK